MPSHPAARLAVATAALAVLPALAEAQSAQRWSLQGSLLHVSTMGDAYEGLDAGIGAEAQVRFNPSAFSIGGGFQVSNHGVDFGDDLGDESVMLAGVFVEPRYVIDVRSLRFAPYVSGRLSFLRQSADLDVPGFDETVTLSASGFQGNVGGGLLVRLTPRVNLDLGATFGVVNFGDVEAESGGETATFEGTSGSGQNLVLRLGLAFGLGR